MKNIKLFGLLSILILFANEVYSQTYCAKSLPTNNSTYYISRVQLKEIDKSSSGSGYSDYTSEKAYLAVGNSYDITIDYYHQNQNIDLYVYFDWDNDGIFDDNIGGRYNHSVVETSSATLTINVPSNAAIGETRMRIVYAWAGAPTNKDACDDPNTVDANKIGEPEDYTLSLSSSSTYPIDLIHFSAKASNSIVEINWTTATEENNDFFTIERSQDGELWEVVSRITGAGNSNELLEYQVVDQMPLSGISYYRLKQTDYDGTFTYSKVVAVNMDEKAPVPISVYPNPATNRIQISTNHNNINEIHIFNMLGQEFTAVVSISQSGASQFSMDISSLPVGVYIVRTNDSFVKVYKQ